MYECKCTCISTGCMCGRGPLASTRLCGWVCEGVRGRECCVFVRIWAPYVSICIFWSNICAAIFTPLSIKLQSLTDLDHPMDGLAPRLELNYQRIKINDNTSNCETVEGQPASQLRLRPDPQGCQQSMSDEEGQRIIV